jgi:hypothetical protein
MFESAAQSGLSMNLLLNFVPSTFPAISVAVSNAFLRSNYLSQTTMLPSISAIHPMWSYRQILDGVNTTVVASFEKQTVTRIPAGPHRESGHDRRGPDLAADAIATIACRAWRTREAC